MPKQTASEAHLPDTDLNSYIRKWYPEREVLDVAEQFAFYVTTVCGEWVSPKVVSQMRGAPPCAACAGAPVPGR